ncbi:hypothetical protein C9374_007516 [Naegleria lovaniensis]|uniref:Uncharacterized protein n=1 Tax=Naegleria lovaniensis TaxID=51637 RepID=A0AA88KGP5_NAELO|nr:uncharacterized protein C9374_007516 [Naegleria lovaniensis]KAG2379377.1 hypothetical protein C9374_007516 [Naegleria lovaniensis]
MPSDKKDTSATATTPSEQKNLEEQDILEDDDFEEFEDENWDINQTEEQEQLEWEEDWDDEDVDDFSKQLREELKRHEMLDEQ